MTTMHVLRILVIKKLAVSLPRLSVMIITPVLLIVAALYEDVSSLQSLAMITMYVLLILVMLNLDVIILLYLVMIIILVPLIPVILN
jgi:hypothetical protein